MYFCIRNREAQGRSPVGLERCSHIAEVIGSSPIVPTSRKSKTPRKAATHLVFASQPFAFSGSFHPLGTEDPAASNHSPHPPNKTVPACCFAKLPLLECKTGSFRMQNWHFWNSELALLENGPNGVGIRGASLCHSKPCTQQPQGNKKRKPLARTSLMKGGVVPPGIEPGTQGFSVLCSTN